VKAVVDVEDLAAHAAREVREEEAAGSPLSSSVAVTAVAELVDKSWM
jgi:hypothetical protein